MMIDNAIGKVMMLVFRVTENTLGALNFFKDDVINKSAFFLSAVSISKSFSSYALTRAPIPRPKQIKSD